MFGKQLPGPADGAVPGQFLIDIMIEEEQDIQSHRTVIDQLAVAGYILKKSNKAYLKEYNRINGLLATITIIGLGGFIQKSQVQCIFESSVKAVLRYSIC